MKKKILWFFIIAFLLSLAYLASLSDPPRDDSPNYVDIDSYISKEDMAADLDTLKSTFDKIHPNPYRFKEESRMASQFDSIKKVLPNRLSIINFWRVVDQSIGLYNDAHSYAEDGYVLTDYVHKGKAFFPLSATLQEEKILITQNDYGEQIVPVGAEIKKINGRRNDELLGEMISHSVKETPSLKRLDVSDDFGFYLWKTFDWDSVFNIHYLSNDSKELDSITVKGISWETRKKPRPKESESFTFQMLEGKVGYMKITDFNGGEKEILDFYKRSFKQLNQSNSSHLILDFRGHQGGADRYGEHLAKHFAQVPFKKLSKSYWKISPEFKEAFDRRFIPKSVRWLKPIYLINEYSKVFYGAEPNELVEIQYELKNPLPEEERFQGEVFLITDHTTFSAASIFAEMFSFYTMGKIVGQPTGNLYSFNGFALANFTLPHSRLSFQVSSVYNVANNEEEGLKSVQPHLQLDLSEDPLQYIIEHLIP